LDIWVRTQRTKITTNTFPGLKIRDVPDIWFWLAGYPVIFSFPVPVQDPAKILNGTGYLIFYLHV